MIEFLQKKNWRKYFQNHNIGPWYLSGTSLDNGNIQKLGKPTYYMYWNTSF
jgi:hypothetical protein